jgi:hypothetical protein
MCTRVDPIPRTVRHAAALCLALAGCSHDLDLPAERSAPAITGFSPASAYSGQLVRLTGQRLDPDAASNTVNFARAYTRGERWDGGALVVRVPAGAGDGAITVTGSGGTSAASATAFHHLGAGEPDQLQVSSSLAILHHPRAVHPGAGNVAIESRLYDAMIWAGDATRMVPRASASVSSSAGGTGADHVYADLDPASGQPRLVFASGAGGIHATRLVPYPPSRILFDQSSMQILTFFRDEAQGVEKVAAYRTWDLSHQFSPVAYGVKRFHGAAYIQGGQSVVVAGTSPGTDQLGLWTLNVGWTEGVGTVTPASPVPCSTAYGLSCPPKLALNSRGQVPLAAGVQNTYLNVAAALEGGAIVAGNTGMGPLTVWQLLNTLNPSPIEDMLAVSGSLALATKPAAGYTAAIQLGGGAVAWTVQSSSPRVLDFGRVSTQSLGYIANDSDNAVEVVDLDAAKLVARVSFDVAPGARGLAGAAAYLSTGAGIDGALYFPSTAFPGLVRFPVGSGAPAAVSTVPRVAFVAAPPDASTVWFGSRAAWDPVAATTIAPVVVGLVGMETGTPASTRTLKLPASAGTQRLAAHGTVAVAAHDAGLTLVDAAGTSTVAAVTTVPGAAAPEFLALGFTPGGDVWTLVRGDADAQVQLWPTAAIAAGTAPSATWTVPGAALSAAWLEDGLWAFWIEAATSTVRATLLDGALGVARTVAAGSTLHAVHAVSPNGRLLVQRDVTPGVGDLVRFFRADPDLGFPEIARLVFDHPVTGFAFDTTGQRLYLLAQGPDQVVAVE